MSNAATVLNDLLIHIICPCCETDEQIGWRAFLESFPAHTSNGSFALLSANFRGNGGRGRRAEVDAYLRLVLASIGLGTHDQQQLAVVFGPRHAREM